VFLTILLDLENCDLGGSERSPGQSPLAPHLGCLGGRL